MVPLETLSERAEALRARVVAATERSGRPPTAVRIVAVSKTMPATMVHAAYAAGFTTFGENRVQEAQQKILALPLAEIRWELIGHLQTNKAARAAELFARVQSVDSLRLAVALNEAAGKRGRVLPVLLEVNVAGEASKSGFTPDAVADAAAIAQLPHLHPEGLMTVAPLVEDAEEVRPVFRQLRLLCDHLRQQVPLASDTNDGGWQELSMGMSDDFEVAIEEGATIVRIGRVLFGERPRAASAHVAPELV